MAYLQLNKIQKSFGDVSVIKGVDLAIDKGEFIVFVGPSGCGKSTLLRLIAGLEPITDGSLTLDGRDITHVPSGKRDLAMVFQSYALYPHMSVYDNMSFALKLAGVSKDEIKTKVTRAADTLNLTNYLSRTPKELSGGQRQRVAIGRAIVRAPKVFLFDEPLSNLDALLRDQTRSELKLLHAELGATSVYVTHDQEEAMTLSDRIVVMSRGHLEQYGTPYEIYHRPATEFVASFVGKPRMNLLPAGLVGGTRYRVAGSSFHVELPGHTAPDVRLGLRPDECSVAPAGDGEAHGTVKVIEPLGNVSDVTIDLGTALFTVRTPGFSTLPVGGAVRIDTSAATLHVFDPSTGARLGG